MIRLTTDEVHRLVWRGISPIRGNEVDTISARHKYDTIAVVGTLKDGRVFFGGARPLHLFTIPDLPHRTFTDIVGELVEATK